MIITNESISALSRNDRINVLSQLLKLLAEDLSTSAHAAIKELNDQERDFWEKAFNEYPNII